MEGSTPQDPQEPTAPQEQPEPTPGDQGEPVPADPTAPAQPDGFNPDEPVRTSAPPAGDASGVPDLPGGANEGVEPPAEGDQPVEPTEPPAESPQEPGDL